MFLLDTSRQQALLDALAGYVHDSPNIGAMVLLGSFANGTADAVSDLDLFFIRTTVASRIPGRVAMTFT